MPDPLLAFEGVSKRLGPTQALRDVTATIDGRAIGLLGPNGAGKTTLMRLCLGLWAADRGEVRVLGLDVRQDPAAVRARLGYAAEGPDRIPGLSGLESVAFAAELCGLRPRAALLRAHEVLDLVDLGEARDRPVETYSTGMHQRVKVAMALVHDPDLILLDEPTSGLDPESRDSLLDLIVRLHREGPAVVLSTHLLHDVERTCDACLILDRGEVRYAGPLDALRAPRSADFEVRAADQPGADARLRAALEAAGATVRDGRRAGLLEVHVPGGDPRVIWRAAAASEVALWHLEPRALSLEEAFLAALAPAEAPR